MRAQQREPWQPSSPAESSTERTHHEPDRRRPRVRPRSRGRRAAPLDGRADASQGDRRAHTNGAYSIAEVYANEGGPPLHTHSREDEAFYVLEGEITFEVGDRTIEAGPGSFVFGPRGVPHRYTVTTPTARMLMLFSPPGFEGFIRATSMPTDSLERPDPSEIEIDWEQVASAAAEYGGQMLE